MHYISWGEADAAPPLLLLHGLASNARIWDKVAPYLALANFRCYALDIRGHGLSDKPENGYGFDEITRDLAAFIQTVQMEKPILVGHSWGAALALDLAARIRVGPQAPAGIILVDGGMIQMDQIPGATWENTRQRLTPPTLAGTPVETFVSLLKDWNTAWKPDDEAISIMLANFEITQDETIRPHLSLDHHMQILQAMWQFQTFDRMGQVFCPVLAIPARMGKLASASEEAFLEAKTNAIARVKNINPAIQVQWMEDSIHDVPLHHPSELAQLVIQFVNSLSK